MNSGVRPTDRGYNEKGISRVIYRQMQYLQFLFIKVSNRPQAMHVSYGFVYYFCLLMIALTAGLLVFAIKPVRRLFFGFVKQNKLSGNVGFQIFTALAFIVIFIIMVDSVMTYYTLSKNLQKNSGELEEFALDNFELVKADRKEDYLQLYRNYREFYMAERNFMLTASAFFIYFAFQSLLNAIAKLVDIELQYEEGTHASDARRKAKTA